MDVDVKAEDALQEATSMESRDGASLPNHEVLSKQEPHQALTEEQVEAFCAGIVRLKDLTPDNFRDNMLQCISAALRKAGGPWQYLNQISDKDAFYNKVRTEFPARTDVEYLSWKSLPDQLDESFYLHLSDFSFDVSSSTKPPPYVSTSIELLDEYLTNDFLTQGPSVEHLGDFFLTLKFFPVFALQKKTSGEPVQLWKVRAKNSPSLPAEDADNGWACYIKGAARCGVALVLAHVCIANDINLQSLRPSLWTSLCGVSCKIGSMMQDLVSVAMLNASLSGRGAIRKAHDVITWMCKLRTLKQANCDPASCISKWNERCTAAQRLEGSKRTCVLALLQWPDDLAQVLLEHVSRCGNDQSCFLEETWANKKFVIGTAPRTNKLWTGLLQLTTDGLHLCLQSLIGAYEEKMVQLRRKYSSKDVEAALLQAQLCCSLESSLMNDHNVSKELLDIKTRFVEGDIHLQTELQAAIAEKNGQWNFGDMDAVKDILKKHRAAQEQGHAEQAVSRNIAATQLEKEEFQLLQKQIEYFGCYRKFF